MDIGGLRSKISKKKNTAVAKVQGRKNVEVGEKGATVSQPATIISGWQVFLEGLSTLKKIALITMIVIASAAAWSWVGWYATIGFWLALVFSFMYLKFFNEIPIRVVMIYDPEQTNEISIKAFPVVKFMELKKDGVMAYHHTKSGVPFYVAKKYDEGKNQLEFTWIQGLSAEDFWRDEQTFGAMARKYDELYNEHLENLTIPQSMGMAKAAEYLNQEHDIIDRILAGKDIQKDRSTIPEERPSQRKEAAAE